MIYSVNDLQNLGFKLGFRGYNTKSVDDVIDNVIEDYQKIDEEIRILKGQLEAVNDSLEQYRLVEISLRNALVVAQQTAEEIKQNAQAKAEEIIKEAEKAARDIENDANERMLRINVQFENTKKEVSDFKTQIENSFSVMLNSLSKSVEESLRGDNPKETMYGSWEDKREDGSSEDAAAYATD